MVSKNRERPSNSEKPPPVNARCVRPCCTTTTNGTPRSAAISATSLSASAPVKSMSSIRRASSSNRSGWSSVSGIAPMSCIRNQLALPNHSGPFSENAAMPGTASARSSVTGSQVPSGERPSRSSSGRAVRDAWYTNDTTTANSTP